MVIVVVFFLGGGVGDRVRGGDGGVVVMVVVVVMGGGRRNNSSCCILASLFVCVSNSLSRIQRGVSFPGLGRAVSPQAFSSPMSAEPFLSYKTATRACS